MASAPGTTRDSESDTPRGPLGAGLGGGTARVPPFCLASLACTGPQVPPLRLVAPAQVWSWVRHQRVRTPIPFRPALVRRLHFSGCGGVRRVGRSGSWPLAIPPWVKCGPRGKCPMASTIGGSSMHHDACSEGKVARAKGVSPAAPFVVCAAAFSGSCVVALPLHCSSELAVPGFGCCVLGWRVSTAGPASRGARAAEAWSAGAPRH